MNKYVLGSEAVGKQRYRAPVPKKEAKISHELTVIKAAALKIGEQTGQRCPVPKAAV